MKLVRDLMTVGVPTCKINTPVVDIARFLIENNVEEMVVLKDESELRDLGINAERKTPLEVFIERRDEARKQAGLT